MKKEGTSRMTALLLAVVLCISLCTGFTSDAQETEVQDEQNTQEPSSDLRAPRIEPDSSMKSGQNVIWDCVWFGSYPQSEVAKSDNIYSALQNATGWDSNNDITLNGNRYRRMKRGNATGSSNSPGCYQWPDSTTYHYFKYEPIKWRVLKTDGSQALLLTDLALDDQKYNTYSTPELTSVTWETSTIRSWLNGYGTSSNQQGIDYSGRNFIGSAFTSNEQSAIQDTSVVNADSILYGTEGGNDTIDKVFLLSEAEVYGGSAVSHGFVSSRNAYDEARRCKSSTYAKAMGVMSFTGDIYKGSSWWWLRSPGHSSICVTPVDSYGRVNDSDVYVDYDSFGVRAALNLDLSSNQWSYAGTVNSKDVTISEDDSSGDIPNEDETIKVSALTISGISKKIAAGKKIKLTAKVSPSNAFNKKVTWKSSNPKVAAVDSTGLVTVKLGSGGKKATITAAATDGSGKKASYTITSMKGIVKKITLSGVSKKIAAGKRIKLTAKITASPSANKALRWKSSNPKAATVTSKGVVTLKKTSGGKTVTITASATDGSGKKASYKITSMKGAVTKIVISGQKTKSVKVGKSLQLKAKVTASNANKANRTLKWTSGNKKYATVSASGKVRAKKAGKGKKVKITAAATDGSGKKAAVTIKIR